MDIKQKVSLNLDSFKREFKLNLQSGLSKLGAGSGPRHLASSTNRKKFSHDQTNTTRDRLFHTKKSKSKMV